LVRIKHGLNPQRKPSAYKSWSAVAGYFDGDGTVEFCIRGLRVEIRLGFDENWKPQLDGLKDFIVTKGVRPGNVRKKGSSNTWHLVVSRRRSVLRMASAMIPYAMKKRVELKLAVKYLSDEITGSKFVEGMNIAVRIGERVGKLRAKGPNYTLEEAVRVSRKIAEAKRRAKRTTSIPHSVIRRIIRDRNRLSMKYRELSAKYGYSRWILRRVIRDDNARPPE
jgi:hypothetical protein